MVLSPNGYGQSFTTIATRREARFHFGASVRDQSITISARSSRSRSHERNHCSLRTLRTRGDVRPRGQNFARWINAVYPRKLCEIFHPCFLQRGRQKRWERSMKSICGIAWGQTTNSKADAIMGPGSVTCGKFAADYRQNPDQVDNLFFTWAQGFMSGFNITETTGTDGSTH